MVPILLALVLTSSVARGGGIVLESYTGERPADAARLLAPILEELSRRDYAAGDTIARSYESQVSRSAVAPGGLPADFGAQVDRGFKAWVGGRFDEAIKVLVPLVETAQANTGSFAKEPALLDPLRKALIALALSYQRNGDPSSMRNTFAEILRIWPDAQISRATYGPDAQTAFDQVKHDVAAAGHGKLTVKTDDAGVVFIDETYRAAGSTTVELAPGEYRVVVMLGKQPSRNHRVTVRANAESTVEIDPRLDQSVRTAGFTGLSFGNQGDRDKNEAAYAQRFARAVGASAVAVVGIDDVHGRSAVIGSLVSLQTGREIRRASIPVEPDPSTDKLRALARFLAGDDPAPGLEVQFSGPTAAAATKPNGPAGEVHTTPEGGAAHAGWWGGWRYVTAGLAVGGIGAGVAFLAIDGGCKDTPPPGQQCRKFYEFSAAAYGSLAGGAVMAGLSIYLFATYHKTPVVQPTQGGATIGFATRF